MRIRPSGADDEPLSTVDPLRAEAGPAVIRRVQAQEVSAFDYREARSRSTRRDPACVERGVTVKLEVETSRAAVGYRLSQRRKGGVLLPRRGPNEETTRGRLRERTLTSEGVGRMRPTGGASDVSLVRRQWATRPAFEVADDDGTVPRRGSRGRKPMSSEGAFDTN